MLVLVPGAGAGAGCRRRCWGTWLRAWWRQVAGAGAGAGRLACICEGVYLRIFFSDMAFKFLLQITMSRLPVLALVR